MCKHEQLDCLDIFAGDNSHRAVYICKDCGGLFDFCDTRNREETLHPMTKKEITRIIQLLLEHQKHMLIEKIVVVLRREAQ